MKILSVITMTITLGIVLMFGTAQANDQNKLDGVMNQLKQQTETNEMQKKDIEAMEKRLECNYNLLQSYNQCEEKHEKNSDGYVNCMKKAKSDGTTCLNA